MTDQAPMTDERALELLANAASIPKRLNGDTKFLAAWHHIKDRLRAGGEAVHFRYEMERMRSVNDHLSRVLTGIHALLYPPTHVVDGATMAFRPKELDAHGLMQSLSDRIRAIPGELAAYAAPPRAPVAEGASADDESPAALLQRLGDDSAKWAAEFRATALRLGYSDMDEGWLIGWFASAIEHSSDVRRWRAAEVPAVDEPARYACTGPQGSFWTNDVALATAILKAYDTNDDWTVTDTAALSRPAAEVKP